MSRAIQRLSLRSAVLLLIMVAQLLIPLLHGHFGTPNQAGLHVHATPSRMADSHFHLFTPHDSHELHEHPASSAEAEPFEVDVQDALQPLDLLPMPLLAVIGLALLTLGLRAARMRCVAPRPTPRPEPARRLPLWRGRVIRPSPAQAPPLAS
ncbi:MAG: hypothetical protein JO200_19515 [Comamonas sp.]|nr:hypothetical protein [Comamonas sp.]